jgi:hypothetical protein
LAKQALEEHMSFDGTSLLARRPNGRRELIRCAIERDGTRWDYELVVDVTTRHVR